MRIKTVFLLGCFVFSASRFAAQGCSDAGVCSAGLLSIVEFSYEVMPLDKYIPAELNNEEDDVKLNGSKPDSNVVVGKKTDNTQVVSKKDTALKVTTSGSGISYIYKYPRYQFQLSSLFGKGEQGTSIFTQQAEVSIGLPGQKLFVQAKVPYTFTSGSLASTSGLGDIVATLSYIIVNKNGKNLSLTGGVKLPANGGDLRADSLPLPMVYQTSLGSTDLLAGLKYSHKKWDFTIGYQHTFNQNRNQYLHRSTGTDGEYNVYFESKELKRADDAIFRINRIYQAGKITANTGLLFIYHLADDEYTNAQGQRARLAGSQGLTLNINLAASLNMSKSTDLFLLAARPVVTRDAIPDGLMRTIVIIGGIKYNIF
ncbi:MAG: hypothetical protein AB1458_01480 [Bacteroidota bacterium]